MVTRRAQSGVTCVRLSTIFRTRLSANFELERIPAIGKNAQVYVGSENQRPVRGAPTVVFVRGFPQCLLRNTGAQRTSAEH
jgi:hypothetical protein